MDQPSQFSEYEELLWHNDILRILVSPYHPPSNVLAMRFVQALCMQWSPQLHTPRVIYVLRRVQNFHLFYKITDTTCN